MPSLLNPFSRQQDDVSDNRPLPEIIADGGEDWDAFPLAFVDDDKRYYAVQDWIAGVAETDNPRRFWTDLKKRAKKARVELYASCVQLPYRASNGKTYQMDYAAAETLYRITQQMDSDTGIRNKILVYLARAGVKLDDYRVDPAQAIEDSIGSYDGGGKSGDWIEARVTGIVTRKMFTDALKNAIVNAPKSLYAEGTESLYKGLWNRTTAQLRGDLGLQPKENVRDSMSTIALVYTRLAEMVATDRLNNAETVTMSIGMEIVYSSAKIIRGQLLETSKYLNIDPFTGQKLLEA